jgi:hypothetical protein
MAIKGNSWRKPLGLGTVPLLLFGLLLSGCGGPLAWRVYPLSRRVPHDGLAVVNQPDGYGIHIWIDTDTRQPGICRPRWSPDPARLFNGNGSAPFSSGLASRQEFFQAVGRWDVRRRLHQESEALCKARASQAKFEWKAPPRREAEVVREVLPPLGETELLPDPNALRQEEQKMLEGSPSRPATPQP